MAAEGLGAAGLPGEFAERKGRARGITLKNIATINFKDSDSGDQALVIVRASDKVVALALSLLQNGDIEVVFTAEECEEIIKALQEALEETTSGELGDA